MPPPSQEVPVTLASKAVSVAVGSRILMLFLVLQLADMLTTAIGLAVGATEANPLAAMWFAQLGPVLGPVTCKMAAAAAVLALLARIQSRWPQKRLDWRVLLVINACYGTVVVSNLAMVATLIGLA
jgi:hypothetical protein